MLICAVCCTMMPDRYWASCAIRSPELSLASSCSSCSLIALCLTLTSNYRVATLLKDLPGEAGLPQKKHVSIQEIETDPF